MSHLLEQVFRSIRERKLFLRGERILVAVSGGVDSMVLLRLLDTLAKSNHSKIVVAHFNHRLRARSSDADERLVRRTARMMGWPAIVERGQVKAFAREHGMSIEMAAREMRHAFLSRRARRLRIRSVALAHHADDQVELFFLRLLRGAGGEGIAGIKWCSRSPADPTIQLVRPLLDVSKADLKKFAREYRVHFREDTSNASLDIQRNRIRHELLPLLRRRFQPALDRIVLRLMDIVGAEAEAVTELAQACLKLKPRRLSGWPAGLQRRLIQLQLQQHKVEAEFDLIETLRLCPRKPVMIGPGWRVACDGSGRVSVSAIPSGEFNPECLAVELKARAGEVAFGGVRLHWHTSKKPGGRLPRRLRGCEAFDADKVGRQIVLRHWQPGDRFQPIGLASSMKLQDWFTNQKVPRQERRNLLVAVTAAGEVFWIENQRIGERFKLSQETKRRLIWTWRRG